MRHRVWSPGTSPADVDSKKTHSSAAQAAEQIDEEGTRETPLEWLSPAAILLRPA